MSESIVIIDDNLQFREAVSELLPAELTNRYDVKLVNEKEFLEAVATLEGRRKDARKGEANAASDCMFDKAAFVIVDYDLIEYEDNVGATLDGEDLAYLVRCFSDAKAIISLNTNANYPRFDLNLKPALNSFANVSVAADDLANPLFWHGPSEGKYRPWAWPDVIHLADNFECRVEVAVKWLDEKLLDVLELRELKDYIDRNYLGLLSQNAEETTVREFVRKSPMGLRPRDSMSPEEKATAIRDDRLARIAASRLTVWLEYLLAGQHVLVDAPHLEDRLPGFFPVDLVADPMALSGLTDSIENLKTTRDLAKFSYPLSSWLDRSVWLWPNMETVEELGDLPLDNPSELVFCEDVSAFEKEEAAQPFRAELATSYPHRFVRGDSHAVRMANRNREVSVEYSPRVRLMEQ